jgi:hypothetical protein
MLARLLPRFEASNARLAHLTGLALADLDYPLPATNAPALPRATT